MLFTHDVKKNKGAAHKGGETDGTCKQSLKLQNVLTMVSLTLYILMQAVYAPPSMRDFLSDEKWGWSEVESVDETVWDQLRNYIPSAGATTVGKTKGIPQPVPSTGATTPGKTKGIPQPTPSAGATTPGKTTETQPVPSTGATTPGKDSFHSETRNRNSVPTNLFIMMKNSTF